MPEAQWADRLTAQERAIIAAALDTAPLLLMRRYAIIVLSNQGYSVQKIAQEIPLSPKVIAQWIRRFNTDRLPGLRDKPRPGAVPKTTDEVRAIIQAVAATPVSCIDAGATRWTLDLMVVYLAKRHDIVISRSRLHEVLREMGFFRQRSVTQ